MKKIIIAICLVLATAIIVSGCSKAEDNTEEAITGGQTKEFTINAKNFEFDVQEMRVNKGDTVKITLKNTQGNHAVKFEGYNKEVKGDKTISFTANKAGEFKYVCSIVCGAGHDKMTGKLIVE